MTGCDVAVVGAGAAGLFAAARIGQAGRSVVLIEHAARLAEKIRISGGGRCNFTNLHAGPDNFIGANPDFCRSALAGYTPRDFLDLLGRHRIPWHEKHKGQLFCDNGSEDIIGMLRGECERGRVEMRQPCAVGTIAHDPGRTRPFTLETAAGVLNASALVIATGGLSIPKIGASDFGLRVARQFGHRIIEPRPALVPLTFDAARWQPFAALAGVSLEVTIHCESARTGERTGPREARGARHRPATFTEDLLFTHRGLSGPAVLQASSYWSRGDALAIDLAPGNDLGALLVAAKDGARRQLATETRRHLPARLADVWLERERLDGTRVLAEVRSADLDAFGRTLANWRVEPNGSEGWRKAEVMAGGVDTAQLSSRSMESQRVAGLYFIGEVVDVTGWLGGYNFQWAWASAVACADALGAGR